MYNECISYTFTSVNLSLTSVTLILGVQPTNTNTTTMELSSNLAMRVPMAEVRFAMLLLILSRRSRITVPWLDDREADCWSVIEVGDRISGRGGAKVAWEPNSRL